MGTLKRTKLNAMSVKQRAKFAAAGIAYPMSTFRPTQRGATKAPKMSTAKGKRRAETGFDKATVDAILERDGYSCVRHGGELFGERGRDWSIQHRRARGSGGTLRPDTNAPQNGLAVCGSGATGCHGHIEAHPEEAEANGYRVPQNGDPAEVPVNHAHLGPNTYLWPNGSWGSRPWREEACA